ncbi:MAG TPA: hypothetical protein VGO24_11305 [Solirubrobacterales bacterium]|nr:hypothetical protein [Solirubrobacterales bacterium]
MVPVMMVLTFVVMPVMVVLTFVVAGRIVGAVACQRHAAPADGHRCNYGSGCRRSLQHLPASFSSDELLTALELRAA